MQTIAVPHAGLLGHGRTFPAEFRRSVFVESVILTSHRAQWVCATSQEQRGTAVA